MFHKINRVSYIAEVFITHLRKQHPSESDIELKDILCVQVAGLCHDLGKHAVIIL